MSLLKDMIEEMAAGGSTGAGSVAGARGSLFRGGAVDSAEENRRKTKMLRRIGYVPVDEVIKIKQSNTWKEVYEAEEATFDTSDVISKLDDAERRAKADKDTVVFGMEDEDGNIIKVYVRSEQADDFEQALATMLAGADEDENDENTGAEIAEVLYDLKDKFEIVDVEWPEIEGDEEEEQELEGGDEGDLEGEGGELEGGEGELDGELDGEGEMVDDTEEAAASTLSSVIDMMKSDAEAKKAEADAKKAEADAEIAKYAAEASAAKVAQEEEILDMEAHEKAKSDADKEAKTLAKLAKYKHETSGAEAASVTKTVAGDDGAASATVEFENEEMSDEDETISKEDLAALLLKHMASN